MNKSLPKIAAVIVARKGSKRIPNKMHEMLGDETLLQRKIRQLNKVPIIDKVYVGSDDTGIKGMVEDMGAVFCRRPDEYCDEQSRTPNDMIRNMLGFFEADIVLWAHMTNPFINCNHYRFALDLFLNQDKCDCLFSADKLAGHFWNEYPAPINHNPRGEIHELAKDLPKIYGQNGGIFIRPYNKMADDGRFVGDLPYMFVMDHMTGWDLNEPWELDLARMMYEKYPELR